MQSLPISLAKRLTFVDIIQIILGSCFIALCSQVQIPLYFTPVPLTLQTFAILMVGVTLGGKKGALATLGYLFQIATGMPVLAGGVANPLALVGPTGGYIFAFVPMAFFAGIVAEKLKGILLFTSGLLAVSFLHLLLGTLWLSFFVGLSNAFPLGFYPFIIGGILKVVMVNLTMSAAPSLKS